MEKNNGSDDSVAQKSRNQHIFYMLKFFWPNFINDHIKSNNIITMKWANFREKRHTDTERNEIHSMWLLICVSFVVRQSVARLQIRTVTKCVFVLAKLHARIIYNSCFRCFIENESDMEKRCRKEIPDQNNQVGMGANDSTTANRWERK